MANGHGGARVGAGRKRKPLAEKILEGTTKKHKPKVLDFEGSGAEFPEPPDYFDWIELNATRQKVPTMKEVYNRAADWLETTGCLHLINPEYIEHYAILVCRWMACEEVVSHFLLGKDVKTDKSGNKSEKYVSNPMIYAGLRYKKAADEAWDKIWRIVQQNSETYYDTSTGEDLMLGLLRLGRDE
ncbi:hypothetical protein FACS189492_0340 [Clostridia bacterium]|nr:hypothetical protein FACS189492_0340 [Clostridia bacterium]